MDEEKYAVAFEMITHAGTAKSCALMAVEDARNFDFASADENMAAAKDEMKAAHDSQLGMLQSEAQGNPVELNIILVHALDHLTMAIMSMDYANEMIEMWKTIQDLKGTIAAQ